MASAGRQDRRCALPTQWALAAATLILVGCAEPSVGPGTTPAGPVDLAARWTSATVAEAGGSPATVERGLDRARANPRLLSLLAAKDGRLVIEEYFGAGHADSLNDVRSVTKSVVSAVTGAVVDRGDLALDDPVAGYLEAVTGPLPPEKTAVTVRQLLAMTSGFQWDESGGGGSYFEWITSDDPVAHLLAKPLSDPPGRRFNYNSAAVHLLGIVLEQATGTSLPDLAQQVLFGPAGVTRARWEPLGAGRHNGGAGLDLRPRDLARFGQLFLQGGRSGSRQVLPAGWVELSTAEKFGWRTDSGALRGISYGFLWWVAPGAPEPFYFAWGYGGQYVIAVPALNLVVVATNDWRGVGADAEFYEQETIEIVLRYVVPAFR